MDVPEYICQIAFAHGYFISFTLAVQLPSVCSISALCRWKMSEVVLDCRLRQLPRVTDYRQSINRLIKFNEKNLSQDTKGLEKPVIHALKTRKKILTTTTAAIY